MVLILIETVVHIQPPCSEKQQENLNWFSCCFILFYSVSLNVPTRRECTKGLCKQPLSSYHQYSIFLFVILLYTITKTAYTITETLILSRKLIGSFRVRIRVLPDSIDFCLIVQRFPCEYPSFRDNIRVLPTSINYQAKGPQNNCSYSH